MTKHERPSGLQPYFDLFKGVPATFSEMSEDVKPAIDILVSSGKAIEQLALDGDSLIYMPGRKPEQIKNP